MTKRSVGLGDKWVCAGKQAVQCIACTKIGAPTVAARLTVLMLFGAPARPTLGTASPRGSMLRCADSVFEPERLLGRLSPYFLQGWV
jgi:hypothetical protein